MKYIFANWKQHLSHSETIQKFDFFLQELLPLVDNSVSVGFAISHESLERICFKNSKHSAFLIGSQNCSSFYKGSFTGEVSVRSLQEIGSKFVLVGHSERRTFLKESDIDIALQIKYALQTGLRPVLCIGESLKEKTEGRSLEVLKKQIVLALSEINNVEPLGKQLLIAYEPQYAIGTGILPDLSDIEEIMVGLQNLKNEASLNLQDTPLLYGGSIDEKNYKKVVKIPYVQGLLIGGASLDVQKFKKIISGCKVIDKNFVKTSEKINVVENI